MIQWRLKTTVKLFVGLKTTRFSHTSTKQDEGSHTLRLHTHPPVHNIGPMGLAVTPSSHFLPRPLPPLAPHPHAPPLTVNTGNVVSGPAGGAAAQKPSASLLNESAHCWLGEKKRRRTNSLEEAKLILLPGSRLGSSRAVPSVGWGGLGVGAGEQRERLSGGGGTKRSSPVGRRCRVLHRGYMTSEQKPRMTQEISPSVGIPGLFHPSSSSTL